MSNSHLSPADKQKIEDHARTHFPWMFGAVVGANTLTQPVIPQVEPAEPEPALNSLETVLDWLRGDLRSCDLSGEGKIELDAATLESRLQALLDSRADPVWKHCDLVDMHMRAIAERSAADKQVRYLRERLTAIATYRDDPICDPCCASYNVTVSTVVQIALEALDRTG